MGTTFSEFEQEKDILIECLMKKESNRIINQFLKTSVSEEEKDKLIEFVMQEDKKKHTFLHAVSVKGKEEVVKLDKNSTILHFASHEGHEEIVKLLLNTFGEEEKDKLIEYVMQEDYKKYTALHNASKQGYEGIVKLLLNAFSEEEK